MWADNLRGTPNDELCVIDWHDCGLADPSQDLALVLYEFASGDAERTRLLYHAYLDAGGPGRIDRPGNFSMAIAQLGHITARACERWLDPSTTEADRGRSASLCREFMARPLTLPVIDELLAAMKGPFRSS